MKCVYRLKHLDLQKVTDEERDALIATLKGKANKLDEYPRDRDGATGSALIGAADVSDPKNGEELPHLAKFLGTIASVSSSLDAAAPRESPMQQLMTRPLTGSNKGRQGTSLVKPSDVDQQQQQAQDGMSSISSARDKEARETGSNRDHDAHAVPQSLGTVGLLRMMPSSLSSQKLIPSQAPVGTERDRPPQDKRSAGEREIKPNSMDMYDVIIILSSFLY